MWVAMLSLLTVTNLEPHSGPLVEQGLGRHGSLLPRGCSQQLGGPELPFLTAQTFPPDRDEMAQPDPVA